MEHCGNNDKYDNNDDDDEVKKTVFRNGEVMNESWHLSYYEDGEGAIDEHGGRTLVRAFQLF